MMKTSAPKHNTGYPTARTIRRACSKELYRTVKRLKVWIPQDKMDEAEALYFKKALLNAIWIYEHRSNRKAQADWWDDNVSADIAALWGVDRAKLCEAFREAYGG